MYPKKENWGIGKLAASGGINLVSMNISSFTSSIVCQGFMVTG